MQPLLYTAVAIYLQKVHCCEHLGKFNLTHFQMWNLYHDPSGKKILHVGHPCGHSEQQTNEVFATVMTHSNDHNLSEKVDQLSAEVKELNNMLKERNERIKELEETKE